MSEEKIEIKVLLIETNPRVRQKIKKLLDEIETAACEVSEAGNLEEAVQLLRDQEFNVILLDINLPDCLGQDILNRIYSCAPRVPIVTLTVKDDKTIGVLAVQKGVQDYLIKGEVDSAQLYKVILYAIEQERVLESLLAALEKYEGLVNNLAIGIYRSTPGQEGHYIEANPAMVAMFEADSREDFLRHKPSDLYQDSSKRKEISDKLLKNGFLKNEEVELKTLKGKLFQGSITTVTKKDDKGNVYFDGIVEDITERKQTEESLRESQQLLRKMFQSLRDAVYILDSKTMKILDCNPAAGDIFGWSREELIGQEISILCIEKENCEEFMKKLEIEVSEKGFLYLPEYYMKRKNGEIFPSERQVMPLEDEDGRRMGWISVVRDITERKKLDKMRDELISTVSHELRTPLTSIKQATYLVASQTAGPINAEQKKYLEISQQSINHLSYLINSLLDEAKIEAGKLTLDKREININPVIEEIINVLTPVAADKSITIKKNLDPASPSIPIDKSRIAEVLENLLSNALKFTGPGGTVLFSTSPYVPDSRYIEISISDTGAGIAKEDFDKLFKRFEQLDLRVQRKLIGTGLGLVLCRQIVELHGGRIWADSEGEGKGSKFTFILPRK